MELYELPFAKIIKLDDDIAEVIINEGVDYDLDMVAQYKHWIQENMADPCYVLVNRINSYSLSFEAQQELGKVEKIKAIALVIYTRASKIAAEEFIRQSPSLTPLNSNVFKDREDALIWLRSQRGQ